MEEADKKAPGGLLFPDKATIFLAAIEDQDYKDEKINRTSLVSCSQPLPHPSLFVSLTIRLRGPRRREHRQELTKTDWDDVYGFDYSCIKDIALREPLVDCVELRAVTTQPCAIRHIDIATVKKEDLTFKVPFELKATRNDCMSDFALWQCPTAFL